MFMGAPDIDVPTDAAGLVRYQDGAVVSQTLVKGKAGTVTLFAFDAGEGLSEHTAPFDALIFALDGRATVTVGGNAHSIAAAQIIRLPASVPHAVQAEEKFKMMLVMIRSQNP